jgi:hypothetical protein
MHEKSPLREGRPARKYGTSGIFLAFSESAFRRFHDLGKSRRAADLVRWAPERSRPELRMEPDTPKLCPALAAPPAEAGEAGLSIGRRGEDVPTTASPVRPRSCAPTLGQRSVGPQRGTSQCCTASWCWRSRSLP